jgi:hypothetical protein
MAGSRRLLTVCAWLTFALLAAGVLVFPGLAAAAPTPTPPPKPAPIKFGDSLAETPTTGPGDEPSDTGYWNSQLAPGDQASGVGQETVAPVPGFITGVAVHGNAISGTAPQPGGGQIFHISILQPLGNGKFQVVTTSTPHFVLPPTTGTYYYPVGRPATTFPMPIQAGQFVSFDTAGGTYNVFGTSPGSTMTYTQGGGVSLAQGTNWTGTQDQNTVVQLQVAETPKIQTTHLDKATADLNAALVDEQAALTSPKKQAVRHLQHSEGSITAALGEANSADHAGEVSNDTYLWLRIPLNAAQANDKQALRPHVARARQLNRMHFAIKEKKIALADIRKAKQLAAHAVS